MNKKRTKIKRKTRAKKIRRTLAVPATGTRVGCAVRENEGILSASFITEARASRGTRPVYTLYDIDVTRRVGKYMDPSLFHVALCSPVVFFSVPHRPRRPPERGRAPAGVLSGYRQSDTNEFV